MVKKIQQPEDLTNHFIQNMGIHFLIANPSGMELALARTLEKYRADTNSYEKWLFLAEQYKKLNKKNHRFSYVIAGLFEDTFKEELIYRMDEVDPRISFITSGRSLFARVSFSPLFISEQMVNMAARFYCNKYVSEQLPKQLEIEIDSQIKELKDPVAHRHYRFLKVVLEKTIQRLDGKDEKCLKLGALLSQLKEEKKTLNIETIKQLTEDTKDVTKVHRDKGLIGFFKGTWAHNTQSFNTVSKVFNEANELSFK